jgi:hypothetical protein
LIWDFIALLETRKHNIPITPITCPLHTKPLQHHNSNTSPPILASNISTCSLFPREHLDTLPDAVSPIQDSHIQSTTLKFLFCPLLRVLSPLPAPQLHIQPTPNSSRTHTHMPLTLLPSLSYLPTLLVALSRATSPLSRHSTILPIDLPIATHPPIGTHPNSSNPSSYIRYYYIPSLRAFHQLLSILLTSMTPFLICLLNLSVLGTI